MLSYPISNHEEVLFKVLNQARILIFTTAVEHLQIARGWVLSGVTQRVLYLILLPEY